MTFRNLLFIFMALALLTHATPLPSVISTSVALNRLGRTSPLAQQYTAAMASYHEALRPPTNRAKLNSAQSQMMACINTLLAHQTHDDRTKEAHESLLQNLLDKHTEIQDKLTKPTIPQVQAQASRRIGLHRRHAHNQPAAAAAVASPQPTARPVTILSPTLAVHRQTLEEWEAYDPAELVDVPKPSEQYPAWHYYDPTQVRKTVLSTLRRGIQRRKPARTASQPPPVRRPIGHTLQQHASPPQTVAAGWTHDARAHVNQRTLAVEGEDFEVLNKHVDSQNGIDCGFHAARNGYEVVKTLCKLPTHANIAETLQHLTMPTRKAIQAGKKAFYGGHNFHRCLEPAELANFIHFYLNTSPIKNAYGNVIQPFENPRKLAGNLLSSYRRQRDYEQ